MITTTHLWLLVFALIAIFGGLSVVGMVAVFVERCAHRARANARVRAARRARAKGSPTPAASAHG